MLTIACLYSSMVADWPTGWTKVAWTGPKGYQGKGNTKRFNERIWFSPHCLKGEQDGLWATNP